MVIKRLRFRTFHGETPRNVMSSLRTFSERLRKVFCVICLIIAFFRVVLSNGGYAQSGANQNPMIIYKESNQKVILITELDLDWI